MMQKRVLHPAFGSSFSSRSDRPRAAQKAGESARTSKIVSKRGKASPAVSSPKDTAHAE